MGSGAHFLSKTGCLAYFAVRNIGQRLYYLPQSGAGMPKRGSISLSSPITFIHATPNQGSDDLTAS